MDGLVECAYALKDMSSPRFTKAKVRLGRNDWAGLRPSRGKLLARYDGVSSVTCDDSMLETFDPGSPRSDVSSEVDAAQLYQKPMACTGEHRIRTPQICEQHFTAAAQERARIRGPSAGARQYRDERR